MKMTCNIMLHASKMQHSAKSISTAAKMIALWVSFGTLFALSTMSLALVDTNSHENRISNQGMTEEGPERQVFEAADAGLKGEKDFSKERTNMYSPQLPAQLAGPVVRAYEQIVLEGTKVHLACPHAASDNINLISSRVFFVGETEQRPQQSDNLKQAALAETTKGQPSPLHSMGSLNPTVGLNGGEQVKWFRNHVPLSSHFPFSHGQQQQQQQRAHLNKFELDREREVRASGADDSKADLSELDQTTRERVGGNSDRANLEFKRQQEQKSPAYKRILLDRAEGDNVDDDELEGFEQPELHLGGANGAEVIPHEDLSGALSLEERSPLNQPSDEREWYINDFGELVLNRVTKYFSGKYSCLYNGRQSELLLDVLASNNMGADSIQPSTADYNLNESFSMPRAKLGENGDGDDNNDDDESQAVLATSAAIGHAFERRPEKGLGGYSRSREVLRFHDSGAKETMLSSLASSNFANGGGAAIAVDSSVEQLKSGSGQIAMGKGVDATNANVAGQQKTIGSSNVASDGARVGSGVEASSIRGARNGNSSGTASSLPVSALALSTSSLLNNRSQGTGRELGVETDMSGRVFVPNEGALLYEEPVQGQVSAGKGHDKDLSSPQRRFRTALPSLDTSTNSQLDFGPTNRLANKSIEYKSLDRHRLNLQQNSQRPMLANCTPNEEGHNYSANMQSIYRGGGDLPKVTMAADEIRSMLTRQIQRRSTIHFIESDIVANDDLDSIPGLMYTKQRFYCPMLNQRDIRLALRQQIYLLIRRFCPESVSNSISLRGSNNLDPAKYECENLANRLTTQLAMLGNGCADRLAPSSPGVENFLEIVWYKDGSKLEFDSFGRGLDAKLNLKLIDFIDQSETSKEDNEEDNGDERAARLSEDQLKRYRKMKIDISNAKRSSPSSSSSLSRSHEDGRQKKQPQLKRQRRRQPDEKHFKARQARPVLICPPRELILEIDGIRRNNAGRYTCALRLNTAILLTFLRTLRRINASSFAPTAGWKQSACSVCENDKSKCCDVDVGQKNQIEIDSAPEIRGGVAPAIQTPFTGVVAREAGDTGVQMTDLIFDRRTIQSERVFPEPNGFGDKIVANTTANRNDSSAEKGNNTNSSSSNESGNNKITELGQSLVEQINSIEWILNESISREKSADHTGRSNPSLQPLTILQTFVLMVTERPANSCSLWSTIVEANEAYSRRKFADFKRLKRSLTKADLAANSDTDNRYHYLAPWQSRGKKAEAFDTADHSVGYEQLAAGSAIAQPSIGQQIRNTDLDQYTGRKGGDKLTATPLSWSTESTRSEEDGGNGYVEAGSNVRWQGGDAIAALPSGEGSIIKHFSSQYAATGGVGSRQSSSIVSSDSGGGDQSQPALTDDCKSGADCYTPSRHQLSSAQIYQHKVARRSIPVRGASHLDESRHMSGDTSRLNYTQEPSYIREVSSISATSSGTSGIPGGESMQAIATNGRDERSARPATNIGPVDSAASANPLAAATNGATSGERAVVTSSPSDCSNSSSGSTSDASRELLNNTVNVPSDSSATMPAASSRPLASGATKTNYHGCGEASAKSLSPEEQQKQRADTRNKRGPMGDVPFNYANERNLRPHSYEEANKDDNKTEHGSDWDHDEGHRTGTLVDGSQNRVIMTKTNGNSDSSSQREGRNSSDIIYKNPLQSPSVVQVASADHKLSDCVGTNTDRGYKMGPVKESASTVGIDVALTRRQLPPASLEPSASSSISDLSRDRPGNLGRTASFAGGKLASTAPGIRAKTKDSILLESRMDLSESQRISKGRQTGIKCANSGDDCAPPAPPSDRMKRSPGGTSQSIESSQSNALPSPMAAPGGPHSTLVNLAPSHSSGRLTSVYEASSSSISARNEQRVAGANGGNIYSDSVKIDDRRGTKNILGHQVMRLGEHIIDGNNLRPEAVKSGPKVAANFDDNENEAAERRQVTRGNAGAMTVSMRPHEAKDEVSTGGSAEPHERLRLRIRRSTAARTAYGHKLRPSKVGRGGWPSESDKSVTSGRKREDEETSAGSGVEATVENWHNQLTADDKSLSADQTTQFNSSPFQYDAQQQQKQDDEVKNKLLSSLGRRIDAISTGSTESSVGNVADGAGAAGNYDNLIDNNNRGSKGEGGLPEAASLTNEDDESLLWKASQYLYLHMRAFASSSIYGVQVDVEWSNENEWTNRTNVGPTQREDKASFGGIQDGQDRAEAASQSEASKDARNDGIIGNFVRPRQMVVPFATIDLVAGQNLHLQCTAQALGRLPGVQWYKRIKRLPELIKNSPLARQLIRYIGSDTYWPVAELDLLNDDLHNSKSFVCSQSITIFDNLLNQTFTVVNNLKLSQYNDKIVSDGDAGIEMIGANSQYNLYACFVDADVRHEYATLGVYFRQANNKLPLELSKRLKVRSMFMDERHLKAKEHRYHRQQTTTGAPDEFYRDDIAEYNMLRKSHLSFPFRSIWVPIGQNGTYLDENDGLLLDGYNNSLPTTVSPLVLSFVIAFVFSSLLGLVYLTLRSYQSLTSLTKYEEDELGSDKVLASQQANGSEFGMDDHEFCSQEEIHTNPSRDNLNVRGEKFASEFYCNFNPTDRSVRHTLASLGPDMELEDVSQNQPEPTISTKLTRGSLNNSANTSLNKPRFLYSAHLHGPDDTHHDCEDPVNMILPGETVLDVLEEDTDNQLLSGSRQDVIKPGTAYGNVHISDNVNGLNQSKLDRPGHQVPDCGRTIVKMIANPLNDITVVNSSSQSSGIE